MKKLTIKKVISIILILVLTASILTSCVSGTSVEKEQKKDSTTDTPKTVEETPGPVTIKVMTPETWAGPEFGYETGLPVIEELEKRLNIKFEWEVYPRDQYDIITRLAAGVDLPDFFDAIYMPDANMFQYARDGIFIPLNDLIEKYAPNIKKRYEVDFPRMKNYLADADGKIYWLRRLHYGEGTSMISMIYREDWLEKVGMSKVPETTEEFYEYLKLCQEMDVNGNGEKDEILTTDGLSVLLMVLSPAFGRMMHWGNSGWFADENGVVELNWITPEAKEFLTYLNKLYKENLLLHDTPELGPGPYAELFNQKLTSNQLAATAVYLANIDYSGRVTNSVSDIEGAKYSVLPPLKGPSGKSGYFTQPRAPEGGKWVITKDCKHPEVVIKLFDYIMSEEGTNLINFGIEGVHWERDSKGLKVKTEQWKKTLAEDPNAWNKFGAIYFLPTWTDNSFEQATIGWQREDLKEQTKYVLDNFKRFENQELAAPTAAEKEILDLYEQDINGLLWTSVHQFVRGELPLSTFDDFVQQIKNLGYDKVKPIKQACYDRYYK